jgi:transposase
MKAQANASVERLGSQWLRTALVEAAHAASHCKECYLSDQYHHLVFRRGKKRAAVALGHTLLIIVYHLIAEKKEYEELGGDYLDQLDRQGKEKRLVRQLKKLGFEVSLTPTISLP